MDTPDPDAALHQALAISRSTLPQHMQARALRIRPRSGAIDIVATVVLPQKMHGIWYVLIFS